MVTQRRGVTVLGCLVSLLIVACIAYFGLRLGRIYWRYYEFRDDMQQEARFASQRTNDEILKHLRASADSLGLPDEAKQITILRGEKTISIESEYTEEFQIPAYTREFVFNPRAEGTR